MTGNPTEWHLNTEPRTWQREALGKWRVEHKGVASVVTGGGKTIFAFLCMAAFNAEHPNGRFIILVPTITLLDQWFVSLREDFGVAETDIACFSSQEKAGKPAKVNLLVINTGRIAVKEMSQGQPCFLIVDECHRAGSPENAKALAGQFIAALGLSATPVREYDDGFERYVVPTLGPVIFEYDYVHAFKDQVIAPFDLINVRINFLSTEKHEYDKLTRRAGTLFRKSRTNPEAAVALKHILQRRAGVSAQARMRVPVAAKLAEANRGMHTIIFHERVASANALYAILKKRNHSVCLYHSRIAPNLRRDNLRLFRQGVFDVLISCRALDEGMNVPETTIAVIASSTASQRQRIQRLGRVLRPARGKSKATIYTLFATEQERLRLTGEAERLEGVASVAWATGSRG
jgi:superfamily II DNA or RNA helicase